MSLFSVDLFQMTPIILFICSQFVNFGAHGELVVLEKALDDIKVDDLKAMADLVEEFILPMECKREVWLLKNDWSFYLCKLIHSINRALSIHS